MMQLTPLVQAFVLHFGEMGSRWGINRTVGQIYALLFVAPRPLNADDLVIALGLSRGSVSMGVKELQSWNLVQMQHRPGDRREYFSTPDDVWQIMRTLVEERKKREIDPTLTVLRGLMLENPTHDADAHAQERMAAMHAQIELLTSWYADMQRLDNERLIQLLKLGKNVAKALEYKDKIFPSAKKSPDNPMPKVP